MDTIDLLQHRRSSKKFGDLAPSPAQLEIMLKSALRAPDHGRLKPYRFVVIEKSGMPQFYQHLTAAVEELQLGEEALKKAQGLSQRAPMIIGVVAKLEHDIAKVPAWEQMLSAGCATYAIQLAANAQGFETGWISNQWVKGSALRKAFGCRDSDQIIALVMIGSPAEGNQITLANQTESVEGFVNYIK